MVVFIVVIAAIVVDAAAVVILVARLRLLLAFLTRVHVAAGDPCTRSVCISVEMPKIIGVDDI
jgi:hypothetical protein